MSIMEAYIPYGAYWSTPFARWQGSFAHLHALEFAAWVARRALKERNVELTEFDVGILGTTVPQRSSFWGVPWIMGILGAPEVSGPTIAQACATSVRCLSAAVSELASGAAQCALVLAADRVSNGPHIYYPDPSALGGTGVHEDWVVDNFNRDPYAEVGMVQTAESAAQRYGGFDTGLQNEITLRRYGQYGEAVKDNSAFLRRFMTLDFEVPDSRYKRTAKVLAGDEGIHETTAEGLAKLKPVLPGGTVTYGGQTHPADGSAGMVVTTRERARRLSCSPHIEVCILGFGQARVEKGYMPCAPAPAAKRALAMADVAVKDLKAIKTHNPFAVNDLILARELGFDVNRMNNYGCSLVWGHPQGPTGLRSIIELIEELAEAGGGLGLFTGCAAGDTGMAAVIRVQDAR